MKAPPNLTGPQARVLMQCLELLIDTLIELYTATALAYPASCGSEPQLDLDFDDEMPF